MPFDPSAPADPGSHGLKRIPAPALQRVTSRAEADRLSFSRGLAAVMVPVATLGELPLVNDVREDSPRLAMVRKSIRYRGFDASLPVVCRIGRLGRWVVEDGGHRLTAARQVAGEWWSNLFRRKVGDIYFLLYLTPASWSRLDPVSEDRQQAAAASDGLSDQLRARIRSG